MDPLGLFLTGALALLVFAGLGIASFVSWRVGVWSALLLFVARAVFVTIPAVDFGPVNIFPDDALFGLLAVVGTVRLMKDFDLASKRLPWLAVGLIGVISVYIGVEKFGIKLAGNESRRFLYFYACTLYVSAFRLGRPAFRQFLTILNWVSLALLLLAGIRWAQSVAGIPAESQFLGRIDPNPDELPSPFRVLYHTEALFLCQVMLLNLWDVLHSPKRRFARIMLMLLFPALVLLQHRTVWVAMFVLGVWMTLRSAKRTKAIPFLIGGVLLMGIVSVAMVATDHLGPVREALAHSVDEPLRDDHSTFLWRVEGWRQLVDRPLTDLATGDPFGSGFTRIIQGLRVEYSPHNYYLETLLRLGIGGLAALLFVYASLFWRCSKLDPAHPDRKALIFVLASQLIYYVTYPATFEQGLLLGMCAAVTVGNLQPKAVWLRPRFISERLAAAGANRPPVMERL